MESSISLLNGLSFNNKRLQIQEGMESSGVFTRERTTQDDLQTSVNMINTEYEQMFSQFDAIKSKMQKDIQQYMNNTVSTNDNTKNSNIIVTEPDGATLKDAKFVGCYQDKKQRAISNMQPEGNIFTVDTCAQRAIDQGMTVFGVQNVNSSGKSQCFTSTVLDDAKKYGLANKRKKTWETKTNDKGGNVLFFGNDGNLSIHSETPYDEQKMDIYVGNSYFENVKKLPLSKIGMSVSSNPVNTQNTSWKDTFKTTSDGITLNVQRTDQNTGWGQYLHLEGNYYELKDALWSSSSSKYNCPPKFYDDVIPSSPDAKRCTKFKLVLQNDGNLVIIDDTNSIIWSSKTSGPGAFSVEEWVKGSYKGRDYLEAGESLLPGQWITSKDGATMAMFETSGNLAIYKSSSPCRQVGGSTYGTNYSNAIYSLPPSNIKTLGNMAYVDDNGERYDYPNFRDDTMELDDNQFITIGTYTSRDTDISSFSATTIEDCQAAASKNPDCGGFVFDKVNQRCSLKGRQMWPKAQRILDTNCIMKIKAPLLASDPSCPKNIKGVSSSQFELYPNSNKQMTNTRKCGVANFLDNNNKAYQQENEQLMATLESLIQKMTILSQQRSNNMTQIPNLREKIVSRVNDYNALKKEYIYYKKQHDDATITQMKRDSEMGLNMNQGDTMWMALVGLGGVLLTMRLLK